MHYPAGEPQGKLLFEKLLDKMAAREYDDDFLVLLIQYRSYAPNSEKFEIFYGNYALAHGNLQVALEEALKAEKKRPLNLEVWKLLSTIYHALGKHDKALIYDGFCSHLYKMPVHFTVSRCDLEHRLEILSRAMSIGDYAPFLISQCVFHDGKLEEKKGIYGGRHIPNLFGEGKDRYWVGAYSEQEPINYKGILLDSNKDDAEFVRICGAGYQFDLIKADTVEGKIELPGDRPCILPIAGSAEDQELNVRSDDVSASVWLGKWQYDFFRIEKPTTVASAQPFIMGHPVYLGHGAGRRKVVLNILVDALSWSAMKDRNYRYVPNLVEFFSNGIIFNDNFSVSEYTYPSLATIETGMYPHHSQVYNAKVGREIDPGIKTMSEMLKEAGYYCVAVCADGSGVYNGVMRGYDRMITAPLELQMYVGAERAIRQLEAFGECDQAILVHVMDTHPWPARGHQIPLATQTRLSLKDRLTGVDSHAASVYLPSTPLYEAANMDGIRNADRSLGVLFDYLESHYDEDEYVVHLYSDHGVPVYDEEPSLLSEHQVGAALMARGANIPHLGFVEELTSVLDIYPIVAYTAGGKPAENLDGNLPAVLGGREREYVISNSIYPGQTYKLAIRTKEHEFYLESIGKVDEDGTVDLSGAEAHIYMRRGHAEIHDESLEKYFFKIVREHTRSFDNEGHFWPSVREQRPEWFEEMA